jgi:hypothetical protein
MFHMYIFRYYVYFAPYNLKCSCCHHFVVANIKTKVVPEYAIGGGEELWLRTRR